jgi:HPt (histidine-containing phosphotransfer) domain-containing protein
MSTGGGDLSTLLKELKQDYLAALPMKIAKIESLHQNQQLKALRDEFHKLKGTGKTYGVPEISLLGEAVEKLCDFHQDELTWVIPSALNLLHKIYQVQQSQSDSRVDEDDEFIKIRQRVAIS